MFDLITIGDSTIDNIVVIDDKEAKLQCDLKQDDCLLCLNYADKIGIKHTGQSIGGNATNVVVGCQKLGLKTSIITELGNDINGHTIKYELEQAKVDSGLIKIRLNKETRFNVILNYKGERTILSYYTERNYNLPKLPQTKWFYYTSLSKNFDKLQKQLISYLKKHPEIKLAVNPGSYQIKYGLKIIKKILPYTEILFVNKQEINKLVDNKKDIKTAIYYLHNLGVKNIVVTDGKKGSLASDNKYIYSMPVYFTRPKYKAGAGDAYASGFLSAIIKGKTVQQAMQWGTANANNVIQKMGAQNGLQTQNGIKKTINKFKQTQVKKI